MTPTLTVTDTSTAMAWGEGDSPSGVLTGYQPGGH
jgi:hypothetical protein